MCKFLLFIYCTLALLISCTATPNIYDHIQIVNLVSNASHIHYLYGLDTHDNPFHCIIAQLLWLNSSHRSEIPFWSHFSKYVSENVFIGAWKANITTECKNSTVLNCDALEETLVSKAFKKYFEYVSVCQKAQRSVLYVMSKEREESKRKLDQLLNKARTELSRNFLAYATLLNLEKSMNAIEQQFATAWLMYGQELV
jgi:hypothetical protein